jgi:hypothetical protein
MKPKKVKKNQTKKKITQSSVQLEPKNGAAIQVFNKATIPSQSKETESDPKANEAICKMNLDLWIHQNNLMWSRLQVLWLVQLDLLSLSTYLYSKGPSLGPSVDLSHLAKYAALLCAVATFALWIVMRTDTILSGH